jgi:hypothetical protein
VALAIFGQVGWQGHCSAAVAAGMSGEQGHRSAAEAVGIVGELGLRASEAAGSSGEQAGEHQLVCLLQG